MSLRVSAPVIMPPGYYYAKPAEHGYATPSGYYVTSLPQAMRHAPVANLYPRNHIRLQIGLHPLGFQPAYPTPPPAPAPVGSFQQTNHAAQPNVFVCTHACGYVASFGSVPVGPVACVCGKPMAPAGLGTWRKFRSSKHGHWAHFHTLHRAAFFCAQ